jgi:hypothetical protein
MMADYAARTSPQHSVMTRDVAREAANRRAL